MIGKRLAHAHRTPDLPRCMKLSGAGDGWKIVRRGQSINLGISICRLKEFIVHNVFRMEIWAPYCRAYRRFPTLVSCVKCFCILIDPA